jgi:hypothetical protein
VCEAIETCIDPNPLLIEGVAAIGRSPICCPLVCCLLSMSGLVHFLGAHHPLRSVLSLPSSKSISDLLCLSEPYAFLIVSIQKSRGAVRLQKSTETYVVIVVL